MQANQPEVVEILLGHGANVQMKAGKVSKIYLVKCSIIKLEHIHIFVLNFIYNLIPSFPV